MTVGARQRTKDVGALGEAARGKRSKCGAKEGEMGARLSVRTSESVYP